MSSDPAPWRLLFVDDDEADVELARFALSDWPQAWVSARASGHATLMTALSEFKPDLVLCDLNLPGFSTHAARDLVRAHAPQARFVMLTGASPDLAEGFDCPVWDKNRLELLPMQLGELLRTPATAGARDPDAAAV